MGKVAFLFSGQGAQKEGMCADLAAYASAMELFAAASDVLGYDLWALCKQGPKEKLDQTLYTQPAVLACDIAAALAVAQATGIAPGAVAGFSLGEVAALHVAGAFDARAAMGLIAKRARYMQDACAQTQGGMAAVIGGDVATVEALCAQVGDVWAVNYNCPGQTVVAGESEALARFIAQAAAHKMRALPLSVSGAFHTKYMQGAADKLAGEMAAMDIGPLRMDVYGNTDAAPYAQDALRAQLAAQLRLPVRWEDTLRAMVRDGYTQFIECGPGKTLTGFVGRMKLEGVTATTYSAYIAEQGT